MPPPPPNRGTRYNYKRAMFKALVYFLLLLSSYQILWTYYLAGVNIPDVEVDPITGQQRVRRRPDRLKKHDPVTGQHVPTSPFDGIMEGYLALINIKIKGDFLTDLDTHTYSNVQAVFCHLTWAEQEQDPSHVPMFADLKDHSSLCSGTMFTADLAEIVMQARAYDARNHTFAATEPQFGQQAVPPTGVVFHQSRCGSTLVSNLLASSTEPGHVRVYSESPGPATALQACTQNEISGTPCDEEAHLKLIRDVFYLMGRVTRDILPQYVYYKIQSVGVHHLDVFQKALPNTPWVFVYRDPTEIIMSHFKNYLISNTGNTNPLSENFMPVCLRRYNTANQSPFLLQIVAQQGRTVSSLSREEYCAAHLASLAEAAIEGYGRNPVRTWFWDYNTDLPHVMWEKFIPAMYGESKPTRMKQMQNVAKFYSKGRGPREKELYKEDVTRKQGMAPEVIKQAVQQFMEPTFQKLKVIEAALRDTPYH